MGKRAWMLLLLLLLAIAVPACANNDPAPPPGTAAAVAPTSASQPTAIPSVTPISASSNVAVYGSVQSDAVGQEAANGSAAGMPLFYSAQSSSDVVAQPNTTPVPLSVTVIPTSTPSALPEGVVTIPPIQDTGPVVSFLNTLCIPLINFILNATIGVAAWLWNTIGASGGLLWQSLLCILSPLGLGWYFLFFRRRRRRRGG